MNTEIENIIKEIHSNGAIKGSIVVTGCGVSALSWLFTVSGTSNTILTSYIPYSRKSLEKFLEKELVNHVSEEEAINMAEMAYQKNINSLDNREDNLNLFGLGCTGAINTNRERRGEDRAHIAIKTSDSISSFSLYFDKHNRNRVTEDIIISKQIINCIAEIHGIDKNISLDLFKNEKFHRSY